MRVVMHRILKQLFLRYRQKEQENAEREAKRIERKLKATRKQSNCNYLKYCSERLDEIFYLFAMKLTEHVYTKVIPEPMVLGPQSRKLYDLILTQIKEGIDPMNDFSIESMEKLSYFVLDFVRNTAVELMENEIDARENSEIEMEAETEVNESEVVETTEIVETEVEETVAE